MTISSWASQERPREKLILNGPASLSHAELLAIFFRIGTPGNTAVDLARHALQQFGGLKPLLESDLNTFSQIKGLGASKYSQLHAALELSQRYLKEEISQNDVLKNVAQTRLYLRSKLRHYSHEVFAMLCLDSQNRVTNYHELFFGTINHAQVYPRVVVKHALQQNAAAVIFAHNHPSGSNSPSKEDCDLTQELKIALRYIDIQVLDHIIIGDKGSYSMAESGLI